METRTVSPGANSGTSRCASSLAICSFSSCSMMFMASVLAHSVFGDIAGPEIGPSFAGEALRFGAPPRTDLFVMAGQQNRRHVAAVPALRPRVVRIFEQPAFEAFLRQRGRLADH